MTAAAQDRRAIITDALRKIDELTARLEVAEKAGTEPIAVVGMACRFPGGVDNPDEYWELLKQGRSGIVRVPPERWDADQYYTDDHTVPGTICNREGGFLTTWQPDEFDAEFFSISPREAAAMDPQQRLLLEVACEALEDAGIPTQAIRGTQTAVFVGLTAYDYLVTMAGGLQPEDLDAYIPTGNAANFAAGRLAYFLGARGPAVVVDTACSSSLTAIHLACQSLRSHESDAAMVGGTNLLLNPGTSIACSRWGMLSPDGQCKTFDAGADGYVRSEGCGVVVLKRLADAQRDGNRVLAVVRGSAVNQDGASSGVTVPNGPAQQALLRQALAAARLQPADIDYVEAHGTGTPLGDPIELEALSKVFGERTDSQPLTIGSVKTNLGHLEAAAGVAGFIKTVLAVQHGYIPKHLNFTELTPYATDSASCLTIASSGQEWPASGRPRRAGVSSFGVSGTNAHVVVEQAPELVGAVKSREPVSPVCTLVVSGKTAERVAVSAGMLARWMAGAGASVGLAEVAHALNHHRTRHARFATVCAADREQAVAGLAGLAAGVAGPGVVLPHEGSCGSGTVFVYSGQGSQWVGMGRQLLADEPAFAAAVAQLEPVFVAQTGFSLTEVLAQGGELVGIERIQPVLVGVQIALTELWRAYGVSPDAVIGHSMGEVAAAVAAGALSPAEGLRVITVRSALMARLAGRGAMALLELDATATDELIAGYPGVSVAVHASPRQTVIAGPPGHVDALIAVVAGQDRLARRIEVDVASHHPTVDVILPELRAALADLTPAPPAIPVFSTVFAGQTPAFDADYWVANLRSPVRFSEAVAAAGAGHATFVEVSPHPLLTHAITETLGDAHHHAIPTLIRDTPDTLAFHTNLNTTHTTHPPTTEHPPEPHPQLPTTPWHHTHHWITTSKRPSSASAPKIGTLLGERFAVSSQPVIHVWRARLAPHAKPYPGYHRLHGLEVVPVSVLLQTLLTAAGELGVAAVSEVKFEQPIILDRPKDIQVVAEGDSLRIAAGSVADGSPEPWTTHVTARLSRAVPATDDVAVPDQVLSYSADAPIAELLHARGVQGQPFAWSIGSYSTAPNGLRARVDLDDVCREARTAGLLDAATQIAALAGSSDSRLFVPASVEQVWVEAPLPAANGSVLMQRTGGDADEVIVDIDASAPDGARCLGLRSLRYVALESDTTPAQPAADPRRFAHAIGWQPTTREMASPTGTIAVIGATQAAAELRTHLFDLGFTTGELADARYVVYVPDGWPATDGESDLDAAVRMSAQLTELVRVLAERADRHPATLWVLTTGVREAADRAAVRQSALWGLGGVIAAEHPDVWGGVIDLACGQVLHETAAEIAATLATPTKTVLLLRDGIFLAPEFQPLPDRPVREPLRCRSDAAYLITGGLGALGLLMATWLVDHGAQRILLAARSPLPPRSEWDDSGIDPQMRHRISTIRGLERRGVAVDVLTIDIGSTEDVRGMLAARDRLGAPPIRGIIHAAGVTHDELLAFVTDSSMREVMWPKIQGAQVLDEAFPCGSVDFFYLTSSAASVFGVAGQGSYAAANAYLDALARARNRRGGHSVRIDWAAWRGLGFAADAPVVAEELRRLGLRELAADEAFAAWEYLHRNDIAQAVVVPVSGTSGDDQTGTAPPANDTSSPAAAVAAWATMAAADVRKQLVAKIRAILGRELRAAESELDTDRPFIELGLNSMMAMAIRRDIENLVGLQLSATMLWNHPTVDSLAAYLTARLVPAEVPLVDTVTALAAPTESVLDSLFDHVESASAETENTHG